MKIILATGIYPPQIGGPAQYAAGLENALKELGHKVIILTYKTERRLPAGLRHLFYFLRLCPRAQRAEVIIALDTWSVGVPAVAAGRLFRKPTVVRVGGDFLWESYINRAKEEILLSEFYTKNLRFILKEKIISRLTRWLSKNCGILVFSTAWQRDIWIKAYGIDIKRTAVIENCYGNSALCHLPLFREGDTPFGGKGDVSSAITPPQSSPLKREGGEKNGLVLSGDGRAISNNAKIFLWAGRDIFLKNVRRLRLAIESAKKTDPAVRLEEVRNTGHEELMRKIAGCRAVVVSSFSEVSPNFVLEAIALKKPVIVTGDSGIKDRIKEATIFIDPRDERDIAEKILWLADEKNYQTQLDKVRRFNFTHTYKDIALEFLSLMKR